ncbi:MAG: hypothetical protein SFW08_08180 [Gemmatimonadaceae bacterium]|nr:hypothetical protein [Gemmatimonadaceae bacterium]
MSVPDPPRFAFPALAARAAGGAIGGARESAMAVLLICRLARDAQREPSLELGLRAERAQHARQWLGTLALPLPVRAAAGRCAEATAIADPSALATALQQLADVTGDTLGDDAVAEIRRLVTNITV